MYRPSQHISRVIESRYKEEDLFCRQVVSFIDQCTKLLKDDRIFLRNKIKQHLRALRENKATENEQESKHIKQLMVIFVEANKKRSLSKIQKDDRIMDELQVKLRKWLERGKKVKHQRQMQNFRKGKFINIKPLEPYNAKDSRKPTPRDSELSYILAASRSNSPAQYRLALPRSSHSKSREKSPIESSRKLSQNHSHSQYSYHKNFSFLKKLKESDQQCAKKMDVALQQQRSNSKSKGLEKKINSLNRSVDNLSRFNASFNYSKSQNTGSSKAIKGHQQKGNQKTKKTGKKDERQNPHKELTKQFTQQLRTQEKKQKQPTKQNLIDHQFSFPEITFNNNPQGSISDRPFSFEESSKKIQKMMVGSRQIYQQLNYQPPEVSNIYNSPSFQHQFNPSFQYPNKQNDEDLFTPPDFLAECRKFISSSHKKRQLEEQSWRDHTTTEQQESGKKMTFSSLLHDDKEIWQEKVTHLGQLGINQVISQNSSIAISTKKPQSQVQFQIKNISIYTPEQLLLTIFKDTHKVSLNQYQLGQLMSQCNSTTQKLFQKYCNQLNFSVNTLELNFISMLKFAEKYSNILGQSNEDCSNFICSVLDMRQKGHIKMDDIQTFLDNMEESGIEIDLLKEIESQLNSIFKRCCIVQGVQGVIDQKISRYSLFYLQLNTDPQFNALKENLNKFDFQMDDSVTQQTQDDRF